MINCRCLIARVICSGQLIRPSDQSYHKPNYRSSISTLRYEYESLNERVLLFKGRLIVMFTKFYLQTLKILHHSPEFLPYVIFLSAPSVASMKQLARQHPTESEFLSSVSFLYFTFKPNLQGFMKLGLTLFQ